MAQEYDDRNQGAAFFNKDKTDEHPKWPDYQGTLDVEGKQYWISIWDKKSKKGVDYLSVSLKLKDEQQAKKRAPPPTGSRPF